MIIWICVVILVSYYLFLIIIIRGWSEISEDSFTESSKLKVSIIIPVRNEESNITRLLNSLSNQNYPRPQYEILIMDDHSTDKTLEVVEEFIKSDMVSIRVFKLADFKNKMDSPKKTAITKGVEQAIGDIILVTDADVFIPDTWIGTYVSTFSKSKAKFICGPVVFRTKNSLFGEIQALEFAVLVATGASTLVYGFPTMCNGANLGFRKTAFNIVGGYEGSEKVISGDDEYLLFKMSKFFPEEILFLKNKSILIQTEPADNFIDFYHQRRRWSGKWRADYNKNNKLLAIFVFTVNMTFLLLPILWLIGFFTLYFISIALLIKIMLEYILIRNYYKEYSMQLKTVPFVITSLLYSIYAITFGFLANFGTYNWKGRNYKT